MQLTKNQEKALLVLREAEGKRSVYIADGRYALIRPATGLALHRKGLAHLRSNRLIRITEEGAAVAAGLKDPADDWNE